MEEKFPEIQMAAFLYVCVCLVLFVFFCFSFLCIDSCPCVNCLWMCLHLPSASIQPLFVFLFFFWSDSWQTCSKGGEGFFWGVRKRLFDSVFFFFFFCQMAKNIRKRTFLCLADVAGGGRWCLSEQAQWGRDIGTGRGNGKVVCFHRLQGETVTRE